MNQARRPAGSFAEQVRASFGRRAADYERHARLQQAMAWRLAHRCRALALPPGPCADLGAGSGLLSRSLIQLNPELRRRPPLQLDQCPELLARNPLGHATQDSGRRVASPEIAGGPPSARGRQPGSVEAEPSLSGGTPGVAHGARPGSGHGCSGTRLSDLNRGGNHPDVSGNERSAHNDTGGEQHLHGCGGSLVWDLNAGLPASLQGAALLASSFALQWLEQPIEELGRWGRSLAPGGWLVLAVPTAGSFPQWHQAAERSGIPCSALCLPEAPALLRAAESSGLQFHSCERLRFSRPSQGGLQTLRHLRQLGANASRRAPLNAGQLRRLLEHWPAASPLTWEVLLLIARRPG